MNATDAPCAWLICTEDDEPSWLCIATSVEKAVELAAAFDGGFSICLPLDRLPEHRTVWRVAVGLDGVVFETWSIIEYEPFRNGEGLMEWYALPEPDGCRGFVGQSYVSEQAAGERAQRRLTEWLQQRGDAGVTP